MLTIRCGAAIRAGGVGYDTYNMRRRASQIVVLLLLGAIMNVAVAWLIVERTTFRGNAKLAIAQQVRICQMDLEPATNPETLMLRNLGWTGEPVSESDMAKARIRRIRTLGFEGVLASCERFDDRSGFLQLRLYGWPTLSLKCSSRQSFMNLEEQQEAYEGWKQSGGPRQDLIWNGALTLGSVTPQAMRTLHLPFVPVWPGFAINTIIYATILCVLFFAPGVLRRTIRRKRGLCPACAYPIGSNPVCTECGTAVGDVVARRV